jgi:hypothetical protein
MAVYIGQFHFLKNKQFPPEIVRLGSQRLDELLKFSNWRHGGRAGYLRFSTEICLWPLVEPINNAK